MRLRPAFLPALLWLALASWTGNASSNDPIGQRPNEPSDLGLREQVERRLIQLDVTVSGPRDVIPTLTADDFELFVGNLALGGSRITDLTLDRFCPVPDSPRTEAPASSRRRRGDPPPRASYVFYFDRTNSFLASSERTHEMVRELIDGLVDERSPATIISGGRTIRTYAYNSSDRGELYSALERLALDASRQDDTITFPRIGISDVRRAFRWTYSPQVYARERAHTYQKEEIDRNYLALTRLSGVMPGLTDLPLPKVVFYIGNRLSSRPGQIYFDVLGKPLDSLDIGDTDPWAAAQDFDLVIQDAATVGARFYPIFPAGPMHSLDSEFMRALRASHSSMRSLAQQTGGQEFFWGVPAGRIVKKLKADLSCVYLLSFDAKDLREDERLGVHVTVKRPKVKARTREQIVVRGPERDREAELLAAFLADGETGRGHDGMSVEIVGASAEDQNVGIVRVRLPASESPGVPWVLGAWLAREGIVQLQTLEQVVASAAGVPVVLEYPMRFEPGSFELILVAHEPEGDRVVSKRLSAVWPDPQTGE